MSMSADLLGFQLPTIGILQGLIATKYLAAAGLTCVLWDHCLTFGSEVAHIWAQKWSFTKVLFVYNRYSAEAGLLYAAYAFAGLRPALDDHSCRIFMVLVGLTAFASVGTANVYIVLRHYALWDRRKLALIALWAAFAISYGTMTGFTIVNLFDLNRNAVYHPILQTCLLKVGPRFMAGSWACMLGFDLFTILLALTNAFGRPHRQRVEVIIHFKRDGAISFLCLAALRCANLILIMELPPQDVFLASFFMWSMVCVTLSRLILRVEEMKELASGSSAIYAYEMDQWMPRYFR